jgi:hypothetical protein
MWNVVSEPILSFSRFWPAGFHILEADFQILEDSIWNLEVSILQILTSDCMYFY